MTKIEWYEFDPSQSAEHAEDTECGCDLPLEGGCTLSIEEGRASVIHDLCGLPLWLLEEDIFAEFPVKVSIEMCSNPGGWHGMTRCECGPEVVIEYHTSTAEAELTEQ